ncbi:hypothetical protein [Actinoplanes derwentensis]|uniref:Uncharacterized protein n=1 Tax=Actinoplanes derwentensis TaxID=113562 RepID=A0A1H1UN63_9ACTN|nr:hypothetical protein [Actinoplanes derwentensis]GID88115.1 hypothetical protein Ade03nite_70390 [Actinoplanes derwentensis]SDS73925.1 hypothetical protein SAMN04489716_1492 [Actinoplanes derwentensis]
MVPILIGRIQTRFFLIALVGSLITLVLVPLLPLSHRDAFVVLAAVAVIGVGWELLYHLLMQFRWEKDWPTLFGLLTGVPEGLLLWILLKAGAVPLIGAAPAGWAFATHFGVVWVAVWLAANGPMRVPFLRWRFRGGRLV